MWTAIRRGQETSTSDRDELRRLLNTISQIDYDRKMIQEERDRKRIKEIKDLLQWFEDSHKSKGRVVEKTIPRRRTSTRTKSRSENASSEATAKSGRRKRFVQAVSLVFSRQVTVITKPVQLSISKPPDGRRIVSTAWKPDSNFRIFPRPSRIPSEPIPEVFVSKEWIWLPSEILLVVAEHLRTSSAAAMTISCKLVYTKLGTRYLRQISSAIPPAPFGLYLQPVDRVPALTPAQQAREDFLAMLDRDSLSFIYCYYCKKLHDPQKTLRTAKWRGLDCSAELAALSKTCTTHRMGYTRQATTEAMIRDGKLLMRIQHWVMIPYQEHTQPKIPEHFNVDICPHIYTYGKTAYPREIHYMIACKQSHYLEPDAHCILCSSLRKCDKCCTEFQIDSKILHGRKQASDVLGKRNKSMFAFVFSVWKDLGDGATSFSPLWEHHMIKSGPSKASPSFDKGSIKAGFEEFGFDRQMKKLDWKELYVNETYQGCNYGESCGH